MATPLPGRTGVQIDPTALARIAESAEAKACLRRVAEGVAAAARSERITVGDTTPDGIGREIDLPVEVSDDAFVVLAHPAGVAVQAKHGTLTRAASARGLKVTGRD